MLNKLTILKWLIVLMSISAIIIFNGCGKLRFDCANTTYTFQAGIKAYPDRDSLSIGDTIWLESTIPASLIDISTQKLIDYSGAGNLGTVISLDRFTGDHGSIYAANEFKYVLSKGKTVEKISNVPDRIREYLYIETGDQYYLKVGIIPQKAGIYMLGVGNPQNVFRNSDKCTKAKYFINFENTKQHIYLYQNNRPGYKIEGLELTNIYCFKVY